MKTDWIRAVQILEGYGSQRYQIKKRLDASGKDMKKDGGVDILGIEDRAAANKLLDDLDEYGLFVVRSGELEHWLHQLKAEGAFPEFTITRPVFHPDIPIVV